MKSLREDVVLAKPNPDRDAKFAHGWFTRPEGYQTLLSMGNPPDNIRPSNLMWHREIMQEFLNMESEGKQITRVIIAGGKTIGVVWVELFENHGVKPPSVHIMIGDPDFRGRGIGKSVMQAAINFVRDELGYDVIYSRHLANNQAVARMNKSLGFENDGEPYADEDGLVWQKIRMEF